MTKPNTVQKTMLEQLRHLNPLFVAEFNVKTIVLMDANTIRLCCRTRRKINFDIHYDRGLDLYDVTAHRIIGIGAKKVVDSKGVMWNKLEALLREAHN